MNLLVTGGCGFIGSNFIRHLLLGQAMPWQRIVNLDKLTYAGNPANLADFADDDRYLLVEGDIADEKRVVQLLSEHEIGAVVHFAAESHVDRSIESPEPFFHTNVIGTLRLIEACRHYWEKQEGAARERFRFLHVSTDEVYGSLEASDPAFSERTAFAPNSPYAASKASSDHLIRAYVHTYGLPALITNCSNNYGPYQFPEKLIPLMILNALEGKPLPIYGDGSHVRDWLYVTDHCEAIATVLERGTLGETYNVGGLCEKTNREVVTALCEILDDIRPLKDMSSYAGLMQYVADRPGHDQRYAIDCSKIQTELGWQPKHTFEQGLEQTVRWYLENASWCQAIHDGVYQRQRLGL